MQSRAAGTSIFRFVQESRRTHRELVSAGLELPLEWLRCVDFLDACRLDEKQVASVLTHAGNQFYWDKITGPLELLYPRGTDVLGKPLESRRVSQPQKTQRPCARPQRRRQSASRTAYSANDAREVARDAPDEADPDADSASYHSADSAP